MNEETLPLILKYVAAVLVFAALVWIIASFDLFSEGEVSELSPTTETTAVTTTTETAVETTTTTTVPVTTTTPTTTIAETTTTVNTLTTEDPPATIDELPRTGAGMVTFLVGLGILMAGTIAMLFEKHLAYAPKHAAPRDSFREHLKRIRQRR